VGKPSLGKGYRDFYDAAFLAVQDGVKAQFVHVGPEPNPVWRGDSPVEHVGPGTREWVELWLCRATVVVVPSRIPDALPRVALEAMAHGRFLVVSDRGGLPECVKPGVTGFIVPAGEPRKLAEAIGAALSDPERLRTGGEWARRLAKERFSPEGVAEAHERMYEELIH
jgi:glycosyltransferase involved in cell wall biosynthesis